MNRKWELKNIGAVENSFILTKESTAWDHIATKHGQRALISCRSKWIAADISVTYQVR